MYGLCGCLPSLPEVLALKLVSCLWLNLCMGLSGCAVAGKHRALWITWRLHSCVDKVKQQGKYSIDAFKMYILGTCMGCWQQWETIQMCACVCVCLCSHKCIKVYNVKVCSAVGRKKKHLGSRSIQSNSLLDFIFHRCRSHVFLLQEDTVYHSWKALLLTLVSQTISAV